MLVLPTKFPYYIFIFIYTELAGCCHLKLFQLETRKIKFPTSCIVFASYTSCGVYCGVTWPCYPTVVCSNDIAEAWTSIGSSERLPNIKSWKNVHEMHTISTHWLPSVVLRMKLYKSSAESEAAPNFNGQ
jgi:hypothetical protein